MSLSQPGKFVLVGAGGYVINLITFSLLAAGADSQSQIGSGGIAGPTAVASREP